MKSHLPHIKPIHAVFCDDIRREVTGKEILIGVYSGNMLVPRLPAPIVLSIWVPFSRTAESVGEIPMEFRLLDADDRPIGYGSVQITVSDATEIGSLSLPALGVMLNHAGSLKFQLKQYEEPWETVSTLKVAVRPESVNVPTSVPSSLSPQSGHAGSKPESPPVPSRRGVRTRQRGF